MISLIAAMARNRVIGLKNEMPWKISEDLKYFKSVTQGRPVVMGRKTYESLGGRLLPGRENRIVSRQKGFAIEGARVFDSLEEACQGEGEIFIIGGAEIYAAALPFADRLYVTLIDRDFEGDTHFPEWPANEFREVKRTLGPKAPDRGFDFSWTVLERREKPA